MIFFLPFVLVFFGGIILIVLVFALLARSGIIKTGPVIFHMYDSRSAHKPRQEPPKRDEPGGWSEGEQVGDVVELPESAMKRDEEADSQPR